MSETIVETHNLFIDSSQASQENGSSGTTYSFNLTDAKIHANSGQQIRLTLNNFTLNRTWSSINPSNNVFYVNGLKFTINPGNYFSVDSLAQAFADTINNTITDNEGGAYDTLQAFHFFNFSGDDKTSKTGKIHLKIKYSNL